VFHAVQRLVEAATCGADAGPGEASCYSGHQPFFSEGANAELLPVILPFSTNNAFYKL